MEQPQMKVNPAIMAIEVEKCPVCTSETWIAAMHLRKIPAVLSPNGQPGLAVSQVGYVCAGCGAVWSPETEKTDESPTIN